MIAEGWLVMGGRISAFLGLSLSLMALPAFAAEKKIPPGGKALAQALALAAPGDFFVLEKGVHQGPLVIRQSLTLQGEAGAVVDGGGLDSVIAVEAPDVTIRGLTIRHSATDLSAHHAGVYVGRAVQRTRIENNQFTDNLFGVYLHGAQEPLVRGNTFEGGRDLHVNERGNGVQMWGVRGGRIDGNLFRHGRDGIFITTSEHNVLSNNRFSHLRFAIHYMYAHNNEVFGNHSEGNDVGYAMMFSNHLKVHDNVSRGDREHGLMFNYTNRSQVTGNRVEGGEKCLFLYNASVNRIHGNHFSACGIGIHFTAGSERNVFYENAFVGNRTQVKFVGTRHHEWSEGGIGNFWSDNPAFDLNGDGLADTAYRPNDLVDQVVWQYPLAKLLLTSPAVTTLRAAQSHFPALFPGGVVDSYPLMKIPAKGSPGV